MKGVSIGNKPDIIATYLLLLIAKYGDTAKVVEAIAKNKGEAK